MRQAVRVLPDSGIGVGKVEIASLVLLVEQLDVEEDLALGAVDGLRVLQVFQRDAKRRLIAVPLERFELDLILGHREDGVMDAGERVVVAEQKLPSIATTV